jgi:hypothetical protein
VKKAQDACGEYALNLDNAGEAVCTEKPEPAKK